MLGRPRHWDYWWDFAFMQAFEKFVQGLVDKGVTVIPPLSDIQKLRTKSNLIRALLQHDFPVVPTQIIARDDKIDPIFKLGKVVLKPCYGACSVDVKVFRSSETGTFKKHLNYLLIKSPLALLQPYITQKFPELRVWFVNGRIVHHFCTKFIFRTQFINVSETVYSISENLKSDLQKLCLRIVDTLELEIRAIRVDLFCTSNYAPESEIYPDGIWNYLINEVELLEARFDDLIVAEHVAHAIRHYINQQS